MKDTPKRNLRIATCIRLGDSNAYNHLRPIADHPLVEKVYIIRHTPPRGAGHDRMIDITVPALPRARRFAGMFRECRKLARDGSIDGLVFFNPFPYAFIGVMAARRGIPYHIGFIGADWYGPFKKQLWRIAGGFLKRASLVTATGSTMRDGLVNRGVPRDRIAILPHSIDLDTFRPGDKASASYDFILVGNLRRPKRPDLVLRAMSIVLKRKESARLCVVGDGPLMRQSRALAATLGIEGAVDFTGRSERVHEFMQRSRVLVMASDREGFPYALVEAMCCGLVPICTDVGTISDTVVDGFNGFLVEAGDHVALSERMIELTLDGGRYDELRRRALTLRDDYSFEAATRVWDGWLSGLRESS